MNYRVIIEKGEDFGFVAHCPAIPGCHSQGETLEDAITNIRDAITGCLSVLDEKPMERRKESLVVEVEV
ncbi:MAG: type II toxin-antitoxin system HicB family antitoxin [Ignavibacteriae bacterium]|nr:type II toxin-antitoxin system HicB family antitoxin [Ignavibacteriota bacterium]